MDGAHDAGRFLELGAAVRILGAFHHASDADVIVPVAIAD